MGKSSGSAVSTELYAWMVLQDLEAAGCKPNKLESIILATVSTTIAFMRNHRREGLAKGIPAGKLVRREQQYETSLLKSLRDIIPAKRGRGRRKDPQLPLKFIRTYQLKNERRSFSEIAKLLRPEFGYGTAAAYEKMYCRYLPAFKDFVRHNSTPLLGLFHRELFFGRYGQK